MEISQLEKELIGIASGKTEMFKGGRTSPEKSGHWLEELYSTWKDQGGRDDSGKRFGNRRLYKELMPQLGLRVGSLYNVLAGKRPLSKKNTKKLMKAFFTFWKYDNDRKEIVRFPYEQVGPDIDGFVDKLTERLFPGNSFKGLLLRKDAPINQLDLVDEYLRDSSLIILASRIRTIIEGRSYADTLSQFRNNIKRLAHNQKGYVCWVLSTGDESSRGRAIEWAEYMNFAIFQQMISSFHFSKKDELEVEELNIKSIEALLREEDMKEPEDSRYTDSRYTKIGDFLQNRACVVLEKCKEKTKLRYLDQDGDGSNPSLSIIRYFSGLKPYDILPLHNSDRPLRIASMEHKEGKEDWHFWSARRRKEAIFDPNYLHTLPSERSLEDMAEVEELSKTNIDNRDIKASQLLFLCTKHRLDKDYSNKAAIWTLRNLGFEVLPIHDFMRYPILQGYGLPDKTKAL